MAGELSADDIVKALTPQVTRSLSTRTEPAISVEESKFVDSLRTQTTRSLSVTDRTKLDQIANGKPNVDSPIEFDLNSAELRGHALDVANTFGKAISSPGLIGQTFLVMGHTDARGTEDRNLKLSERRAGAVKDYLVKKFDVKPENLIAVGYGKTRLKNPADPFSAENRRVQMVNVLAYKSAGQ